MNEAGVRPPEFQKIEREYQRDVRITEARPKIQTMGLFVWTLLDVALILFFILHVVLYVVSGSFADTREVATIDDNLAALRAVSEARAADPLIVGNARTLAGSPGTVDFYAVVENPNTEWYAKLTYHFTTGDAATDTHEAVILPGEETYVTALGVASATRPTSNLALVIDDLAWERVDRHAVPDTAEFLRSHRNFTVTASYGEGQSTFTITNATPYTYREAMFLVTLKRAGTLVGLNQVTLSNFLAGETREVQVRWFGDVPAAATTELTPRINYFDPATVAAPEGETTGDIRDSFEE